MKELMQDFNTAALFGMIIGTMIFGISYFIGASIQKIKMWLKQKRRK